MNPNEGYEHITLAVTTKSWQRQLVLVTIGSQWANRQSLWLTVAKRLIILAREM